jgi:hypothetical protein
MNKSLIATAAGMLIAAGLAFGITTVVKTYQENNVTYSAEDIAQFRTNYIEGCIGADAGLSPYCECTYTYMEKELGVNKIVSIAKEYETTNEIPSDILPAVNACMKELP